MGNTTYHRRAQRDEQKERLYPLQKAFSHPQYWLYWIPASLFPLPFGQKQWLMQFLDRFLIMVSKEFKLRPEIFLQFKTVHPDLLDPFMASAMQFSPITGLSLRPGDKLRPLPNRDEISPVLEAGKFNIRDYVSDYCYWFTGKFERKQREMFLGYGGLTLMLMKPDKNTQSPDLPIPAGVRTYKIFEQYDLDAILASAFALRDGFLEKSKKLFGASLAQDPQFPGIPFVIPLLQGKDFFSRPVDDQAKWFEICDIYINESPCENGIILASKIDVDEALSDLLGDMKRENLIYPER